MASSREVSVIIRAVDRATRILKSVGKATEEAFQRTAQHAEEAGRGLAMVGAAGTAALGLAVHTAASFQQEMANTQSVANATAEELQQLTDAARKMGKTTVFSARQSAQAMYFLASAGLNSQKIIGTLNGVLSLAAATQADLAFSSRTVVSTLSAFNMAAGESDRVANTLAAAISGSQATIDRLATSLSIIGPISASVNMSLEETIGVLGELYNKGIDASTAGTSLRMAIARLVDQNPPKELEEVLTRLQVSVRDAHGELRPFLDIIRDLEQVGLSTADAMAVFGVRSGPAMLALVNQGADALDDFTKSITGTNKAVDMAERQINTFQGQTRLLRSAIEELQISIGEKLMPTLTDYVQRITLIVNKTSEWMEQNPVLAQGLVKVGGALAALTTGIGGGLIVMGSLSRSLISLTALIGGPATGLIAGILAAAAAFGFFIIKAEAARAKAQQARTEMSGMFNFEDVAPGNAAAKEFIELNTEILDVQSKIREKEAELEKAREGMKSAMMFGDTQEQLIYIGSLSSGLEILENRLDDAQAKMEKFLTARPKPQVDIPDIDTDIPDAVKVVTDEIAKLEQELATELARVRKSETDFAIYEVEEWAKKSAEIAKDNADLLVQIDEIAAKKIAAIRRDARVEEAAIRRDARVEEAAMNQQRADEMLNIIGIMGGEVVAREAAIRAQAKQIQGTMGAVAAQKYLTDALAKLHEEETTANEAGYDKKLALLDNLSIKTLEAQGKMKEAALERLELERVALEMQGITEVEYADYITAQKVAIEKQYTEKVKEDNWQMAQDITNRRLEAEQELSEAINGLRQSDFNRESGRIRAMQQGYVGYIRTATRITQDFFSEREGGQLRALANLIRFGTRMVSDYLKERALEKLKQADQAQTQAQLYRHHVMRMGFLMAEAAVLAIMATAAGNFAAAFEYGLAIKAAGASALAATTAAGAMEAEAVALQTSSATMMTAAVAVEAAGEVAATGIDMAAEAAERKARQDEDNARKAEQRLDEELRLRQQILEMEGRTQEARRLALQDEADRLRALGINESLINRYEQLSLAQAAGQPTSVASQPAGTTTTVATGSEPTIGGSPRTVIEQTNNFYGILDTASEEQKRELVIMLKPYLDEIAALEG